MKRLLTKLKEMNFTDVLIVTMLIGTFFFVREVFSVFRETGGGEPSTLVTSFFALVTAELAILWRLHESKKKRMEDQSDPQLPEEENDDLEVTEWEDET